MFSISRTSLFNRPSPSTVSQFLRRLKNDRSGRRLRENSSTSDRFRFDFKGKRAGRTSRSVEGIHVTEATEMRVPQIQRSAWMMWKPMLFTVGFGGCCYAGAAVWEYEHNRRRAEFLFNPRSWSFGNHDEKMGQFRRKINDWWTNESRGRKVFWSIVSLNGLVFAAWHIPAFRRTMIRYFTSSFYGEKLCSPMILSAFSHYSTLHLGINMYVLWSFSAQLIDHIMGPEQFVAFYLTAGVVASLAGYFHRAVFRMPTYALGASGAILAVLTYTCARMPDSTLSIIFLPWITFSGTTALIGIVATDALGLLLGWRLFDHAAHLGGSLFGIWYAYYGEQFIWQRRQIIVQKWKQLTKR